MIIKLPRDKDKMHPEYVCKGEPCPIHNPSDHKMKDWPMNLRTDAWAFPLIERICPHGVGHPDPDSIKYMNKTSGIPKKDWGKYGYGTHGCDGCCRNEVVK